MASLEKLREAWQRQLAAAPELGPRIALTGVAISWHLNRETGLAFPSMKTLASLTGCSSSTVKRAVKILVTAGHMTRVRKRKNGPNHYAPVLIGGEIEIDAPKPKPRNGKEESKQRWRDAAAKLHEYVDSIGGHGVIAVTPHRVTAMDHRWVTAMTPEPLNQPPIEPGKGDFLGEKGRGGVPVEVGTDQWKAWARVNDAEGKRPLAQHEIKIGRRTAWGRYFPNEWPPQ